MKPSPFFRFFPVPRMLAAPVSGVDLSDQSVKFVSFRPPSYTELAQFGEETIPLGAIEAGKIKDQKAVSEVLRRLKATHRLERVAVALPEEQTYVIRLALPAMRPSEVRGAIELQLEDHIPLPAEEVIFDYEIFSAPRSEHDSYDVAVAAAPRELVHSYSEVFRLAGLEPVSLEIEMHSLARAFLRPDDQGTYLLADIGKTRTGFAIVSRGIVVFASTINSIGGENLTAAVAKVLGVERSAAEEIKIRRGLLHSPKERGLFEALVPTVSTFRDEISRHLLYWQKLHGARPGGGTVEKVILGGGQATLPGLTDYVMLGLETKVELGNPWARAIFPAGEIPPIHFNQALRYGTAIGLALRHGRNSPLSND